MGGHAWLKGQDRSIMIITIELESTEGSLFFLNLLDFFFLF